MPNIAVSKWVLAVALAVVIAQPAEARRRFGFGGGSSRAEKIIGVRDLPDTETFRREGVYWDLGLLYTERSVLGMTVSGSPADGRPVLYNGDRYIEMTPELQAMLTAILGEDVVATAKRDQAKIGESIADANADRPAPGGSGGGGLLAGFGLAALSMLALLAALLFGARRIWRRLRAGGSPAAPAARRGSADGTESTDPLDTDSFDRRVAARLAQLRGDGGVESPAPSAAPALATATAGPVGAAPRGFGRKGL